MEKNLKTSEFSAWIRDIKEKIHAAQRKVAMSLNSQLIELYWEIGHSIVEKQEKADWGSAFIDQAALELKHEFPDMKGFSRRNLYAMGQWYRFYSSHHQSVPQCVAQLPWGHNRLIISKVKILDEAEFYCNETIKNGWDRDTLEIQMANNLYKRKGRAQNNFMTTLPADRYGIVSQTLKDPYNFDFLGLHNDALERAIEDELTAHITQFLLELGNGFAFMGRQYKIEIADTDYFMDMLFYHTELRCYVVVELKAGKFKPEYAGKLNFYLSAVDSQLKRPEDNPTIGILLCRGKNKIEAEYALRDINKPMGISEYRLTEAIPDELKTSLPSIEDFEKQLEHKIRK